MKPWFVCLVSLTTVAFFPVIAGASGILYQFNTIIPSEPRPAGPTPWLTADFENAVGGVDLTISAKGLAGSEFASEVYFNIAPNLDQSRLKFTRTASTGTFSTPTIDQASGDNNYKAGGNGKFDFRFEFGTAHGTTFGSGDSVTYFISGILGLTANNFACMSTPTGGGGSFYAAAHVQSLPNCNSTWIKPGAGPIPSPVPEPSSIALCTISAVAGLVFLRRKMVKT